MYFDQINSPPGVFLIFSYRAATVFPLWVPVAIHTAWGDVVIVVRTLTGWLSKGHIYCNFDMYKIFRILRSRWFIMRRVGKHSGPRHLSIVLQLGFVILFDQQYSFTCEVATTGMVVLFVIPPHSFSTFTPYSIVYEQAAQDMMSFLLSDAGTLRPYPSKFQDSFTGHWSYSFTNGIEAILKHIRITDTNPQRFENITTEQRITSHVHILCDITSPSPWVSPCIASLGPLFTRQTDVLPRYLVNICLSIKATRFKFILSNSYEIDRNLDAFKMPIKFQNSTIVTKPNLTASMLHEIWQ